MDSDAVEGPVGCISRDEVVQALSKMKSEGVPGPSDHLR